MRAIPDDNLSFPVLVTLGNTSGSGFYLNTDNAMYLITARHVLFEKNSNNLKSNACELLSYCQDPSDKGCIRINLDLSKLHGNSYIYSHPDKDIASIKICEIKSRNDKGLGETVNLDGVTITNTTNGYIIGVPTHFCKKFDDVLISNQAFLFGYPVSLGIKQAPQFDYNRPLLRGGIIAGKHEDSKNIILDCTVYPGNSGGPVIEVEIDGNNIRYRTIGLVSEFIPMAETLNITDLNYSTTNHLNSGYSVIVSMDPVFELLGLNF